MKNDEEESSVEIICKMPKKGEAKKRIAADRSVCSFQEKEPVNMFSVLKVKYL
jgi:hypothetical protein